MTKTDKEYLEKWCKNSTEDKYTFEEDFLVFFINVIHNHFF
jgi:hypothetical protein